MLLEHESNGNYSRNPWHGGAGTRRAIKPWAILLILAYGVSILLQGVATVHAEDAPVATVAISPDASNAQDALAVLGIEDRRTLTPGDTSLMAGLSNLLEFSLQQRGARMLDRQTVSRVLGERRLNRLLGDANLQLSKVPLPEAAFAVKGHLTDVSPNVQNDTPSDAQASGILLTLELYRTRDGSLLQRVTMPADTTAQLGDVVDLAAAAIDLSLIATATLPAVQVTSLPEGFTERPEAALLFYRGLDHMAANRNTIAAGYFIAARRLDWQFDVAKVWQYRALERGGFGLLAASLLATDEQYGKTDLRQRIESTRQVFAGDRLVIAVASTTDTRSIARNLEQKWANNPQLSVLTPNGLMGSTAEQDLKLTGEFAHLPAVIDRWLFADVFVRITPTQAVAYDVKTGKEITRCDLAQAGDGAWLREAQLARAQHVEEVQDIQALAMKSHVTADPQGTRFLDIAVEGYNAVLAANAQPMYETGEANKIAMLLERIKREPGNISAWHALSEKTHYWGSGTCAQMMIDLIGKARMEQKTQTVPDVAAWLSEANHTRYESLFHAPGFPYYNALMLCELEKPVAEQYKELLAWFPNSTAAWMVRYSMALESEERGQIDEAVAMMLALAQHLPELDWIGKQDLSEVVGPNVHYQLARMYTRQGNLEQATHWHGLCAKAVEASQSSAYFSAKRSLEILCRSDRVDWYLPWGASYSHQDTIVRRFTSVGYLDPKQRELGTHLGKVHEGQAKLTAFETYADLHAQVLKETDAQKRFDLQLRSVKKRFEDRGENGHHNPNKLWIRQIAWLRLNASTLAEHKAIDNLIYKAVFAGYNTDFNQNFLNRSLAYGNDYELMMLHGDKAPLRLALSDSNEHLRRVSSENLLFQKLEMECLALPPAAQAQRILEAMRQFEKDNPQQVTEGSLTYYNLIGQLAPLLMARGRFEEATAMYQKIIDDTNVPWTYRDRARLHQSQALWRAGRPHEAGEQLRGVSQRAASKSSLQLVWGKEPERRATYYAYTKIKPENADKLMTASRDSLHRLRLFGGRVKSDTSYQQHIEYAPLPDDLYAESKLYALMMLFSVPTRHDDFYGDNWWSGEAGIALQNMQEQALPYAQRLLWCIYLYRANGVNHDLAPSYRAMGWVYQFLSPAYQLPEAQLLDWLAWSPVCEMKMYAARCLRITGIHTPEAATALVLTAAMNDGCQFAAREVLKYTGGLEPSTADAVATLLDHPAREVRAYAAQTLAKGVGMRIDNLKDDLPDEDTITSLREWWRSIDGDPSRWPVVNTSPTIAKATFDRSGTRWVTWGAGPLVKIYQTGQKTIMLNHDEAASIMNATISRDGKVVATFAQDHKLRIWDLAQPDHPRKPRLILTPLLHPNGLTLGEHGNHVAFCQVATLFIYDAHNGQVRHKLDQMAHYNGFTFLDAQDTQLLILTTDYANPTLYDLNQGKVIDSVMGTYAGFVSVHKLQNGRLLTHGSDYTVRLWETAPKMGNIRIEGRFGTSTQVSPSSDLQRIAGINSNRHLCIWDAHNGKQLMDMGEVSNKYIALAWPANSGPVLIHSNLIMQRFSQDLRTSTTVSFDEPMQQNQYMQDSEPAATITDEQERQALTSKEDDSCCQLIIRR